MSRRRVKANLYEIVSRAVEEGVQYGYSRSFKHTDNPDKEVMIDTIYQAVMNALCEVIKFDE